MGAGGGKGGPQVNNFEQVHVRSHGALWTDRHTDMIENIAYSHSVAAVNIILHYVPF